MRQLITVSQAQKKYKLDLEQLLNRGNAFYVELPSEFYFCSSSNLIEGVRAYSDMKLEIKPRSVSYHVEAFDQRIFFKVEEDKLTELYQLGGVTIESFSAYLLRDLKSRENGAPFWICEKEEMVGLRIPQYIVTSLLITEDDLRVLTGSDDTWKDKLNNIQSLELKYPSQSDEEQHPNQSSTLVKMYNIAFHVFSKVNLQEDKPTKLSIRKALIDWGVPEKEAETCTRVLYPTDEEIDKNQFLSDRFKGVLGVWEKLYKNIDPKEKDTQPDEKRVKDLLSEYCPSMSKDDKHRICTSLRPDLISRQGR
jgi:hypothetical protein